MKVIYINFLQMIRQMKEDIMLLVIAFVPVLAGVVFRFIIPAAEHLLTAYYSKEVIVAPYYDLLDLFLIILTPSMFNYVAAMVILEEADDHMIAYLALTPLGKGGYLLSRLGITGIISFLVSILVALLFHNSNIGVLMLAGIALAGTIQGVVVALLIVVFSANKVEGLAIGKMSTLLSLGMLVPYFITGKGQYLLSVLPSFWMAKAIQSDSYLLLFVSIILAVLWVILLSKKFMKKITG